MQKTGYKELDQKQVIFKSTEMADKCDVMQV
jgi:hypothetical protein